MIQLFTEPETNRSAAKVSKCTTYACDTVRTTFLLEPCMRRHEVSRAHRTKTLRAVTKLKGKRKQRNKRLSAHQSATSATQDLRFSQKYTTFLDVHCAACLKHLIPRWTKIREMRGTGTYCSSACLLSYAQANRHLLHTITAMVIWASPSRLTCAAENSHFPLLTLDVHALTLAEQSLGKTVMTISPSTPQRLRLSEYLEALLPMECVPEISLCLEPALNRGSLH